MRLTARLLLCILFSALLASGPASAAMYKCIEDNKATYSDKPCSQQAQELQNKVSVVAAPVPAKAETGTGSRWTLGGVSITGSDVVAALLVLIPVSIIVMVVLTRKSESR